MKAAATLNINNGNPQENKLQREKKKVQVFGIHCMSGRAFETKSVLCAKAELETEIEIYFQKLCGSLMTWKLSIKSSLSSSI